MELSQARVFMKLIKILTLKPHHRISRAPASLFFLQTRLFSDIGRPIGESEPSSFNSNGDGDKAPEHIPNKPLRGHRPLNPSFREAKGATVFSNGSSFQSRNTKFASDPDKKKEDSHSDVNFLEKFKLGLDNKRETQPSDSEAAAARVRKLEQEEKLSPPQDANEIFRKMKETGLIPNAVAMLDGLCKDGLIQEAMKLFGLMREKGTIPEVVVYTAVVDGFCKAHKLDDAKRIFRKMQSKGVTPNAFSFTVLIQGLYKCKQLDDAIEFCLEMLEAGHSPNVATFVGLVDGLCEEKSVEEAESVIGTLKQKGFVVNDKAVRQFLDKKAPFSPLVWEAIFGKKTSRKTF